MTISALATPAAEMGGPLNMGMGLQRAKQLDRGPWTVSLRVTQVPDLPGIQASLPAALDPKRKVLRKSFGAGWYTGQSLLQDFKITQASNITST